MIVLVDLISSRLSIGLVTVNAMENAIHRLTCCDIGIGFTLHVIQPCMRVGFNLI